jgi:exodeoxyribonuclease VII large subunit
MNDAPTHTVYAVSELVECLRALVEDSLPTVWVEGEISNFSRPASGHWYFTLKDERAQLRCAMFRGHNYLVRPVPKDGDRVRLRGRASVYPARGELQLVAEHLEPAGLGALLAALERLKKKLEAEGLFDPRCKRPLPVLPRRIGVVTSAAGAALHDVLTTLARRWPLAQVYVWPVPVQGQAAAPAIARALAELPRRAPVELVLLVRGGGSIEDLWAFNDERVVRAIRACAVPVVSGVGHEIDVTLADFAADLRAATPTAAAERISPDRGEFRTRLARLDEHLRTALQTRLQQAHAACARLAERLQRQHPGRRLEARAQRLDELEGRLHLAQQRHRFALRERLRAAQDALRRADPRLRLAAERRHLETLAPLLRLRVRALLERRHARLRQAQSLLDSLNPQAVLARGYAIVRDEGGAVLRAAGETAPGRTVEAQLARGRLRATVRETHER